MELTTLETAIGLHECKGKIKVGVICWDLKGQPYQTELHTTRAKFHNAIVNNKTRYSTEKMIQLCETDRPDAVKAVAYRAQYSDARDLAVTQRGACHLGVFNE